MLQALAWALYASMTWAVAWTIAAGAAPRGARIVREYMVRTAHKFAASARKCLAYWWETYHARVVDELESTMLLIAGFGDWLDAISPRVRKAWLNFGKILGFVFIFLCITAIGFWFIFDMLCLIAAFAIFTPVLVMAWPWRAKE